MIDRRSRHRRFPLSDVMILTASIAVGIWVWNTIPSYFEYHLGFRGERPGVVLEDEQPNVTRWIESRAFPKGDTPRATLTRWTNLTRTFVQTVLPFVTIGASFVTFRHRANRSRRALRQVGILTTAVAAAFVGLSLANEVVLRRFKMLQVGYWHNEFDSIWGDLADELSLALAALWVVLACGRLWRPEPHWDDRLGRLIGTAWIAYAVLEAVPRR